MLTAGDEVLRTQRGNNNAYCQDNDVSWLDWSFAPAARAMLRFTRELIALRKRHPSLRRARFLNGHAAGAPAEIQWYGERLEPPAWQDADARVLCFTLHGRDAAGAAPARHDQHGGDGAQLCRCRMRPYATGAASPIRRSSRPTTSCRRAFAVRGDHYRLGAARYRHLRGRWDRGRVIRMKYLLLALLALGCCARDPSPTGSAYYGLALGDVRLRRRRFRSATSSSPTR